MGRADASKMKLLWPKAMHEAMPAGGGLSKGGGCGQDFLRARLSEQNFRYILFKVFLSGYV